MGYLHFNENFNVATITEVILLKTSNAPPVQYQIKNQQGIFI